MIYICMSLHDGKGTYSKYTATAMASVCAHTEANICFYILHDDTVNEILKASLTETIEQFGQDIKFIPVEIPKDWYNFESLKIFTVGTMFRLLIPELIPKDISKAIFLDSDTVTDLDITELWDNDISEYPVMGRKDMHHDNPVFEEGVDEDTYINAGVMLMNLDMIRKEPDYQERSLTFIRNHPNSSFADQDVINYIFNVRQGLLPERFNMLTVEHRSNGYVSTEGCIYHFAGDYPHLYGDEYFDRLFFEYLNRTSFTDLVDNNNIFYNGIRTYYSQYYRINDFLKKITASQTVVFWGAKLTQGYRKLKEIVNLNGKEVLFADKNKKLTDTTIDGCRVIYADEIFDRRDLYVIVLAFRHYDQIRNELVGRGFMEYEDFSCISDWFLPDDMMQTMLDEK